MSDSPPVVLDEDVTCIQCGYNLRGLTTDGRCPECSAAVERSLRDNRLQFADADWLGRVKLGADLLYCGIVVSILLVAITALCSVWIGASGLAGALMFVIETVWLAWPVFYLGSIALLTTREPRLERNAFDPTSRGVTRVGAILLFFCHALNCVYSFPGRSGGTEPQLLVAAGMLCAYVTLLGKFTYARSLALRIPDERLARSTTIVKWGLAALPVVFFGITVGLGIYTGMVVGRGAMSTTHVTNVIVGTMFPLIGFGGLIVPGFFALWACRLLSHYRKAFKAALAVPHYIAPP